VKNPQRAWEIRLWTNDSFFELENDVQAWIICLIVMHKPEFRMEWVNKLIAGMGW
jgi:hypothetical protein